MNPAPLPMTSRTPSVSALLTLLVLSCVGRRSQELIGPPAPAGSAMLPAPAIVGYWVAAFKSCTCFGGNASPLGGGRPAELLKWAARRPSPSGSSPRRWRLPPQSRPLGPGGSTGGAAA